MRGNLPAAKAGRLIAGADTTPQRDAGGSDASASVGRETDTDSRKGASRQSARVGHGKHGQSESQDAHTDMVSQEILNKQCRRLFQAADVNGDGSVDFREFANQHRRLLHLSSNHVADCAALTKTSMRDLEREFRNRDADNDMELDFGEYSMYMDNIRNAVGVPIFTKVSDELFKEMAAQKELASSYDSVASDLLLEKTKAASMLRGDECVFVDQLLARRANPNYCDGEGNTVTLLASEKASAGVMAKLLQADADPASCNNDGDCALLRAARSRNLEVVKLLLLPNSNGSDRQDAAAISAQMIRGMPEASEKEVRELITQKADLNIKDENGWTPLIAAVFWGRKDCVEAILRFSSGSATRLKVDIPNANGHAALHVAARKGREDLIPILIKGRSNPDLRDNEGWTPLHHASFNGMDEAVKALITAHADLTLQGSFGFTPWMVSMLPTHAGTLQPATLSLLEPNEKINFSKKVIPILNSGLRPYEKLENLFSLPSVSCNMASLRLYEQFFSPTHGPNKVRLMKMWEGLGRDLLLRLRSGETDLGPQYGSLNEDQEQDRIRRWQDQKAFLELWFRETRGPPLNQDWSFDNRECYREDLQKVIAEEAAGFGREFAVMLETLRADEHGVKLCSIPPCEVLKAEYLMQCRAHPILEWLESQDARATFNAMMSVKCLGSNSDINESICNFMGLVSGNADFCTARAFWSNIYKLWLHHYGQLAQMDFQRKILAVVASFNEKYDGEGLQATCHMVPVKSYERMKTKETELGGVDCATSAGRRVASHLLDIVRLSVTVNNARAAVLLVDEFFRPMTIFENRCELVRIRNGFHESAATASGYRSLLLNVYFDGGLRSVERSGVAGSGFGAGSGSCELHLALVGEVQVVLSGFLSIKKRMHVVTRYLAGEFDHAADKKEVAPAKAG